MNENFELKTEQKTSTLLYVLMLYFIMGSDTVLFGYNSSSFIPTISEYIRSAISLVFLFAYLLKCKGKVDTKFTALMITIVWLVFVALIHGEFSGGYISKITLFVLGYCFFRFYSFNEFKIAYLNVMTAICAVSLLTYFLSILFSPSIFSFLPMLRNTTGHSFYTLFLTNVSITAFNRNFGPFTEPSRYQAYINLGIALLLFDKEKTNVKRVILFIVTLITTLSTTGYIVFIVILIALLFSEGTPAKTPKKILFLFILLAGLSILFFVNEDFAKVFQKIGGGTSSESFSARYYSIFAGLKLVCENFFFGTGISNAAEAYAEAVRSISSTGSMINTNTILLHFSKFGFVAGFYYIYNYAKFTHSFSRKCSFIFLFLAFILMVSGISFLDSILFNVVIFGRDNMDSINKFPRSDNNENIVHKCVELR